jgi:hypothetical protein
MMAEGKIIDVAVKKTSQQPGEKNIQYNKTNNI